MVYVLHVSAAITIAFNKYIFGQWSCLLTEAELVQVQKCITNVNLIIYMYIYIYICQ